MQLNQNYPWYLQTSTNFSSLYEGMFNVAKNFSPIEAYRVMYPDIMAEVTTTGSAENGLKIFASLWGLPTEMYALEGALIYDVDNWSETKKWSGSTSGIGKDWFLRYIKMKTFINSQPFSLQLIHDAMDILFGDEFHTITVTESGYNVTVNITTTEDAESVISGLLVVDPTLFGKPIGISISYNIN